MRALILCAGQAARWSGDTPKQLVRLRGEPVVHRAVRLLRSEGVDDVRLVVRDARDPQWKVPGASRATARLDPGRVQADKVLSSEHLWNPSGRTLVLFGDVYWTDDALARLVADDRPWVAIGRSGASTFTGCAHRELFGFAFDAAERPRIRDAAHRCLAMHQAGTMGGWSGGWQVYAAAAGADDEGVAGRFVDRGNFIDVDDWTDDLDYQRDWDRWCWHWGTATPQRRAVGHREG